MHGNEYDVQPVVNYWPGSIAKGRPGHISMELGKLYVSHVPLPWGAMKSIGRRTVVDNIKVPVPIQVKRCLSCACHTFDADKEKYGKPQTLTIPGNKVDIFRIRQHMSHILSAMDRNPLSPPRPLGHFDASNIRDIRMAFPRHTGNYHYYQLCDSAADPDDEQASLRGDRSNCATTVADCIAAGIPMERQEIYKTVAAQFDPNKLFLVLSDVFDVTPSEN